MQKGNRKAARASGLVATVSCHDDDIHSLCDDQNGGLLTGSKDGTVRRWSVTKDFSCIQAANESEAKRETRIDYTKWITSMAIQDSLSWVSGTRDGIIDFWEGDDDVAWWPLPDLAPLGPERCKKRNETRVTCLSALPEGRVFVGRPGAFHVLDPSEERAEYSTQRLKSNDWPYCCLVNSEASCAYLVCGPQLGIWEYSYGDTLNSWEMKIKIDDAPAKNHPATSRSKFFISHIDFIKGDKSLLSCSKFDSRVYIYDTITGSSIVGTGHGPGRVWMAESLSENVLVSCSDDSTFKLWDKRYSFRDSPSNKDTSIFTSSKHAGRVSAVKSAPGSSGNVLVTASCPDKGHFSGCGTLSLWDIRALSSSRAY